MKAPSDTVRAIIRIADGVDASQNPSISRVSAEIKKVIASLSEDTIISKSSFGDFSYTSGDNPTDFTCPASHVGTFKGKPFKLSYIMHIKVEIVMDADEDGPSSYMRQSSDGYDGNDNTPQLEMDGVIESDVSGIIEEITSTDAFMKADSALATDASEDVEDSSAASDWKSDLADSAEFARDPYSYYGVKRSDF